MRQEIRTKDLEIREKTQRLEEAEERVRASEEAARGRPDLMDRLQVSFGVAQYKCTLELFTRSITERA